MVRRNAVSRKDTGSSPDEVIKFFTLPDTSSRTIALGLTQSLTEMSTRRYFLGVKRDRRVRLTREPIFRECGILDISQPYMPPRPVTGIALLFCQS
jgi:hypothetical protein